MDGGLRYFAGLVAFGFAAVWITWSLPAALVCLLSAAAGYGAVTMAQHTRAKMAARGGGPGISDPSVSRGTAEADDLDRRADALNLDLGHVYEPTPTTPPVTRPADDAASPDETSL